jgi:hypothetical protein
MSTMYLLLIIYPCVGSGGGSAPDASRVIASVQENPKRVGITLKFEAH